MVVDLVLGYRVAKIEQKAKKIPENLKNAKNGGM
jgi:hypothetical protein